MVHYKKVDFHFLETLFYFFSFSHFSLSLFGLIVFLIGKKPWIRNAAMSGITILNFFVHICLGTCTELHFPIIFLIFSVRTKSLAFVCFSNFLALLIIFCTISTLHAFFKIRTDWRDSQSLIRDFCWIQWDLTRKFWAFRAFFMSFRFL